jgi:hypothetical protein
MSDDYGHYLAYFESQANGRGVGGNFKSVRLQKGNGIGSFFGGLFRKVMPYIKSGASALGNELLNSGVGILRDHLRGVDPKASIKTRVNAASTNLGEKASAKLQSMLGLGYKKRHADSKPHSSSDIKRRRVAPGKVSKRKPRRKRDIFGF